VENGENDILELKQKKWGQKAYNREEWACHREGEDSQQNIEPRHRSLSPQERKTE
jgi:hypothetical protein